MKKPIYLDYAATTPVDPEVATAMMQYLTPDGQFGNPASRSHRYGWQAEEAVDVARNQVAELINADPREVIWTSGATESDNLAIKGVAARYRDKGKHIITSVTEHKAVIDTCVYLEQQGFEITYLQPSSTGLIEPEQVNIALRDDTVLVSLMMVNNETGVIQDIQGIGELLRSSTALFHVDAAQATGKVSFDVKALQVDLASFSAHKVYGPKGIGALYVRRSPGVQLEALIHGGGHEKGMRSGTLPTHQVVGMGEAFRLAGEHLSAEPPRLKRYKLKIWQALKALGGIRANGDPEQTAPSILNITIDGVDVEALLAGLSRLALSTGSACNSASVEPSYVLRAMGLTREQGLNSVRISVGRFTTEEEVNAAIELIIQVVQKLRTMR